MDSRIQMDAAAPGTGAPAGHGPTVDSKAVFLSRVEDMAMNAISTVAAYNAEIQDSAGQTWNTTVGSFLVVHRG